MWDGDLDVCLSSQGGYLIIFVIFPQPCVAPGIEEMLKWVLSV